MAKRILTLCLALVIGIAFAMPAAAAVKSIKVGGDLVIRGIYRDNLDFNNTSTSGSANSWVMSTTRIFVGADLTDNVSAVVRLLNERDWNGTVRQAESANSSDSISLDLAYIKMKDLFIPGFTATLGRQEILLGKGFVVGNANFRGYPDILAKDLTARKSFDAWRLDYEVGATPVTVTLFDAKLSETADNPNSSNTTNDDEDLWGLNVGYKTDNLQVEGYALMYDRQTGNVDNQTDLLTYGARVDHSPSAIPGLNYNIEAAMQTGNYGSKADREGWAGNGDVSYTFQNPMQPKIGAAWFYTSGDEKATATKDGTWIPLFADNHSERVGRIGYARALYYGPSGNVSIPKIYVSIKPSEKHLLSLAWFPTSTLNSVAVGAHDDLGNEIDLGYAYQYTEDVSFGLCADFATAGKAIVGHSTTRDDNAMQVMGTVAVSF